MSERLFAGREDDESSMLGSAFDEVAAGSYEMRVPDYRTEGASNEDGEGAREPNHHEPEVYEGPQASGTEF